MLGIFIFFYNGSFATLSPWRSSESCLSKDQREDPLTCSTGANQTNLERSKEISWNRSSGCFRDPVVEQIPCLYGKKREDELELVLDPILVDHFTGSLRNDILSHSSGVSN